VCPVSAIIGSSCPGCPPAGDALQAGLSRQELSSKLLAGRALEKAGACFFFLAHEEICLAKFTLDYPGICAVCRLNQSTWLAGAPLSAETVFYTVFMEKHVGLH